MGSRAAYISKLCHVAHITPENAEYSYPFAKGWRLIAAARGGLEYLPKLNPDETYSALMQCDPH